MSGVRAAEKPNYIQFAPVTCMGMTTCLSNSPFSIQKGTQQNVHLCLALGPYQSLFPGS